MIFDDRPDSQFSGCADLTALALRHGDSVGLRSRAEVIGDDVITESGVCGAFYMRQSTDNFMPTFFLCNYNSCSGPTARQWVKQAAMETSHKHQEKQPYADPRSTESHLTSFTD